jgi:hypothetical protein
MIATALESVAATSIPATKKEAPSVNWAGLEGSDAPGRGS